jgi:glutathione synthase
MALSPIERAGYILMDRILPPSFKNILVRNGRLLEAGVVSELGVYGIWIRCVPLFFREMTRSNGDEVVENKVGGHLLRTKVASNNEGGVAAGFAVVDSPVLF